MKDNTARTISLEDVSEELVIEYLCAHPEFFQRHEDLLDNMYIPHPCQDKVVSLIERQVERLRQQHADLQTQMLNTIAIAKENELLFQATKQLTTSLLQANDFEELVAIVQHSIKKDFKVDSLKFGLVDKPTTKSKLVNQYEPKANVELKDILKSNQVVCKQMTRAMKVALFGDSANQIGSLAVIPLGKQGKYGYMAIGSEDKRHFHKDMDTLFLDYIGQIISQLLPKFL